MSATGLPEDGFGFGRFEHDGRSFVAVCLPDGSLVEASFRDTDEVFADWDAAHRTLTHLAERANGTGLTYDDVRPLPPVTRPNLHCAGANFRKHVIEMMYKAGAGRREGESDEERRDRAAEMMAKREETEPFMFQGNWSALCGARDEVTLHPLGVRHDWELELAAVIGRSERHVSTKNGHELIAGYTIVNDMGTMDLAVRSGTGPMSIDFTDKFQPTFKPAGPFIVPKEFVDLDTLTITLKVNGNVMQYEGLDDMVFPMSYLVGYASSRFRLVPGDLVLSGSPAGNAAIHGGAWLKAGDVMEAELTYLGRQRNHCVDEQLTDEQRANAQRIHQRIWDHLPSPPPV
jgi:2-keto-4-pentenoate hydratase/2-oxohepta-3-ene-1,7-dioic acid hydratase in catechol pathway